MVARRVNEEKGGRVTVRDFGTFRVRDVAHGEERAPIVRRVVNFRSRKEANRLPG